MDAAAIWPTSYMHRQGFFAERGNTPLGSADSKCSTGSWFGFQGLLSARPNWTHVLRTPRFANFCLNCLGLDLLWGRYHPAASALCAGIRNAKLGNFGEQHNHGFATAEAFRGPCSIKGQHFTRDVGEGRVMCHSMKTRRAGTAFLMPYGLPHPS